MTRKAVILAAGRGARLAPLTCAVPKELLPLAGFPALHHVLAEAARSGVGEALVVLSKGKECVRSYWENSCEPKGKWAKVLCELRSDLRSRLRLRFATQESLLGTGDAILLARSFACGDPILVLYPDDILGTDGTRGFSYFGKKSCGDPIQELWARADEGRSAVLVREISGKQAKSYGVVYSDSWYKNGFVVRKIEEKPRDFRKRRAYVLVGRMVLTTRVLDSIASFPLRDDLGIIPALNLEASIGRLDAVPLRGECLDLGSQESYLSAVIRCVDLLKQTDCFLKEKNGK